MKAFNIGIILCIIATSTIIAFVECCLKDPIISSLEVCAFITKRERNKAIHNGKKKYENILGLIMNTVKKNTVNALISIWRLALVFTNNNKSVKR
jgi:hypothetical protein